jgi:hypothetical protein
MAPKITAGTRKLRMSRLTDVLLPVSAKTSMVRPNSTMLPPTWVTTCAIQSERNFRLRSTAMADPSGGVPATAGVMSWLMPVLARQTP